MKRRFGMWMTIICILVVGISVTRMTREFVVSQGVETAAIVSVMDAGKPETAVTDGENAAAAAGNLMPPVKRLLGGSENGQTAGKAPAEQADGYSGGTDTDGTGTFEESFVTSEDKAAAEETAAVIVEGYAMPEEPEVQRAAADVQAEEPALEPEAKSFSAAMAEYAPAANEVTNSASASKGETAQETVKSPLDPVVETGEKRAGTEYENVRYNAEDFLERFQTAESNAEKIWETVLSDNMAAYNAAAEQEWVLWDYELNLVYNTIRGRMSDEEAERLKILELEWIKDRDLYAEKAAVKGSKINGQNPDYTKALTDKTKERCYWLVSEYEDLLNGEDAVTKKK